VSAQGSEPPWQVVDAAAEALWNLHTQERSWTELLEGEQDQLRSEAVAILDAAAAAKGGNDFLQKFHEAEIEAMTKKEINWHFVESEAEDEALITLVKSREDFILGYKAGYLRCWNQQNGTWPE
jgi:hypothetical protein